MNEELRIDTALRHAAEKLAEVSDSPRLDAEILMTQALDVSRSYLFTHPEDTLDPASIRRYFSRIDRRRSGEPMAYIQGQKEFWSLPLMVSPATLVPRPETETLVQQALNRIPRDAPCDIADLGTGSGAIALAIARERPESTVTATDISASALGIARENARQLEIINVSFEQGNWIEPLRDRTFDLIVSNPPYISDGDPALASLQYEPRFALASGSDGLDAIRVLAGSCSSILKSGGSLLLEHGASQQREVAEILAAAAWREISCIDDLAGLPRVTATIRPLVVEDRSKDSP